MIWQNLLNLRGGGGTGMGPRRGTLTSLLKRGLRFGVWGLGFGVSGLMFGVWGFRIKVWGLGLKV